MTLITTNGKRLDPATGEYHAVDVNGNDLGVIMSPLAEQPNANIGNVGLVNSSETVIDPATSDDIAGVVSAVEALAVSDTATGKTPVAVSCTSGNRQTLATATTSKKSYLLSLDITASANGTTVSVCYDDDGSGTNETVIASWTFAQYGGISIAWAVPPETTAGKYLTIKSAGGDTSGFASVGVEV